MNHQEIIYGSSKQWTTHVSDVLVIGGGFSGLWAAIKASEAGGVSVNLVDKGYFGSTSHSFYAGGGMVVLMPEDNLDEWVEDIARANENIADKEAIRAVLKNSYQRMKDYEAMGVCFPKVDGEYRRLRSRGVKKVKLLGSADGGGKAMVVALHKEAIRRGVSINNRIFIIDLLLSPDGEIGGAIGVDIDDFQFHVFRARVTILATNSGSFRGHHLASDQQGTGVFVAFEAGATLRNAEFHYINIRPTRFEIEGSGIFPKFGARWSNADNEYFMDKYAPEEKDHASNHRIVTAMAREALAGKAPMGFDTPSLSEEGRRGFRETMMSHGWMKLIYNKLRHDGIDFLREKIEWNAAYETNRVGIHTDLSGKAHGVERLYAAGMARAFIPNMLTGFSIAYTTWSGYVAGEAVAGKVKEMDLPEIDLQQILLKKEKFLQPLSRKGGTTPDDVVEKLQKAIFPANVLILVKEEKLQAALQEVKKISAELVPQMTAPDLHELIKARETETMLVAAELTLRASMLRKESRPAIFYREDYAQRDDANWLKWILIRKTGDGISYSTIPIIS